MCQREKGAYSLLFVLAYEDGQTVRFVLESGAGSSPNLAEGASVYGSPAGVSIPETCQQEIVAQATALG